MDQIYNKNILSPSQTAVIMVKTDYFQSIFYLLQYPTVLFMHPQMKEAEEITYQR